MREHKGPPGRRAKGGTDNDWPTGKTYRGIDAARGPRKRDKGETECGDGCCCIRRMHYGITMWMAVSKFARRNRSYPARSVRCEWKSGAYVHGVLGKFATIHSRSSSWKLIRLGADERMRMYWVYLKSWWISSRFFLGESLIGRHLVSLNFLIFNITYLAN